MLRKESLHCQTCESVTHHSHKNGKSLHLPSIRRREIGGRDDIQNEARADRISFFVTYR